jgi:hypothetical protein
VLGVAVGGDYGEFVFLQPVREGTPALAFQRVPDPTPGKNRIHVDLRTDDRVAEVARLTGLGATYVADREMGGVAWTVLADPEGNQFCLTEAGSG